MFPQQNFRNNVSSFAGALTLTRVPDKLLTETPCLTFLEQKNRKLESACNVNMGFIFLLFSKITKTSQRIAYGK